MNVMRRKRLHAAVSAALVGLAGTTGMVEAQAAPAVKPTGTGQVLIFPYYTVNGNWITTFNVMNTSDKTLAVKVRFRERKNSRDALDFTVAMSPRDAWTAFVKQGTNAEGKTATQLFTQDESCTSPQRDAVPGGVNGAFASPSAYTNGNDDSGGQGTTRLLDGYVEMIVMGETDTMATGTVPYYAEHVDGVPRDCAAVDSAFAATVPWNGITPPATLGTYPGTGDPDAYDDFAQPTSNPLKGNIAWLNIGSGAGAGGEALAVSDWAQANLVTAQTYPWFLEPTLVTGTQPWVMDTVALSSFEDSISASTTFNEWADNPVTGAVTDWVVTFPTKGYHVDKFNTSIQAAINKWRNDGNPVVTCDSNDISDRGSCEAIAGVGPDVAPFEVLFGVLTDGVSPLGDSPITISYEFCDREEGCSTYTTDGTSISPAPPGKVDTLRYEANVIQFTDTAVLASPNPSHVVASDILNGARFGWTSINFLGIDPVTADPLGPVPVVGFAIKVNDQGEPTSAYGQQFENGYGGGGRDAAPAASTTQ